MEDTKEQKPNGTVVEEATSTTTVPAAEETTKRSIRVKIWQKFREIKSRFPGRVFNKIPDFVGAEKAAELLSETTEFKNAKNIKVNVDRAQDPVKLNVVKAEKTLFLAPSKTNALYTKIDCSADTDDFAKLKTIKDRESKGRQDIDLVDKMKLNMVVIGCVAVTREGRCIGRGNGFIDLDLAILIETGAITPETVIATTVHDVQILDSIPEDLFTKYDVPVDMIVTPTEVIRVEKRLPRPSGLFWEILSERRLKILPVLQVLKENEETAGKIVVLKAEDTDVESGGRRRPSYRRPSYPRRRNQRRNTEPSQNQENQTPRSGRRKPRNNRPRKSDGEQSENEKENKPRKKRAQKDFCVKVTNISRDVRIKDLKAELRNRNCTPIYISWKGTFGKCYLHFAKRTSKQTEDEINDVLQSLKDLTLTIPNGETTKTLPLTVELFRSDNDTNRIESVSTTAV